jgi:hypothetical protein
MLNKAIEIITRIRDFETTGNGSVTQLYKYTDLHVSNQVKPLPEGWKLTDGLQYKLYDIQEKTVTIIDVGKLTYTIVKLDTMFYSDGGDVKELGYYYVIYKKLYEESRINGNKYCIRQYKLNETEQVKEEVKEEIKHVKEEEIKKSNIIEFKKDDEESIIKSLKPSGIKKKKKMSSLKK